MDNPKFQKALLEIKKLVQEKNNLLEIIQNLKISLHNATKQLSDLKLNKINHTAEAEEAMKRYTDKLRKESEQNAKQKQSKRKQVREASC